MPTTHSAGRHNASSIAGSSANAKPSWTNFGLQTRLIAMLGLFGLAPAAVLLLVLMFAGDAVREATLDQLGSTTMVLVVVAILAGVGAAGWLVGRGFVQPIITSAKQLQDLADSNDSFEVAGVDRVDEIGDMARAIEALRVAIGQSFRLTQMVEQMPVGVMMVDIKDLNINYMNAFSRETLKKLEHLLPVKVEQMMGQCIDVFHKVPSHQRRILSDPRNLPHKTNINVGPEVLALEVNAIKDKAGNYIGPMLTWSVVTEKVKADAEAARLAQMVEQMPVGVMMVDTKDFNINYMNSFSRETLKKLEHLLPVKVEQMMGQCIDVFHKVPANQRRILSDPRNLPHKTNINVGPEVLALEVNAIKDKAGNYIGPMLTWSVVTEKIKADNDAARLLQMVDNMPINVMMTDPKDFIITYANKTSVDTLRKLEHLLPVRADQLVGSCVDVFHKNPQHQRRILGDPRNLPYKAKIKLGEETLQLNVAAVFDKAGGYIGPMLSWEVVTKQVRMATRVAEVVGVVSSAATEMQSTAQSMSATAEETSKQAAAVAAASEEAATNVQTVAAATEELSSSITEIGRQVTQSSAIAAQAVADAEKSNKQVQGLAEAAQKIGEVVSLINDIAAQTNLLALNATIEAARAGDAGKGFAVVASEVKSLANQTAKATEEIGGQIAGVQSATHAAVEAIKKIGERINELAAISTTIAAAVEEQGAATKEISGNVAQAASGTQEVNSNITGVNAAASETGQAANQVLTAAAELAKNADALKQEVKEFLGEDKAA